MDPSTQMQEMLLGQLRDIHLPAEISWWPLAPGWWLVAALFLGLLVMAGLVIWRYRQAGRYRREAGTLLAEAYEQWSDDQKSDQYLFRASRLIRQIAVHVCGRQSVSSVTGDMWMNQLAGMSTRPVPESLRYALTHLAYQPNPRINIDQAHQDILDWLHGVSRKQYLRTRSQPQNTPLASVSDEDGVHV
jgi:hypothetical protein